jgi:ABC-2 type transport system permease protein
LSDEIRDGKLYAFVEIPKQLLAEEASSSPASVTFVSQDAMLSGARQWLNSVIQERVNEIRLQRLGLDPVVVSQANAPVVITPKIPFTANADGSLKEAKTGDTLVALFLPFGVMMLMFLVIFLAAQPMLESGMEEKGQRIAEVLLGSVTPTQLMAGKLLGNVAGSLMIFAIYGIGGWVIADQNGWSSYLPWELVPWFIVFQLLGVLFFSSIFLTVGASISELKEAQSLLMPIWLVLMMPMMIWLVALRDPNGIVATSLSFFPPSAPLMMILRLASGQTIPAWQPPAAALLLLASTAVVVYFAGRIYRASLLRTDSARTVRQIFGRLGSN